MGYDHDTITTLSSEYNEEQLHKSLAKHKRENLIAEVTGFDIWDIRMGRVSESRIIDRLIDKLREVKS
jgi:hypothetical protein